MLPRRSPSSRADSPLPARSQALASLNHTNIAAIYDLEESNGIKALVLELVEGDNAG